MRAVYMQSYTLQDQFIYNITERKNNSVKLSGYVVLL